MAPAPRSAAVDWAAQQVLALVEIWALIAECSGLVGAWRLMTVCKASQAGTKHWLSTLPRFVMCGVTNHLEVGPIFGSMRLDLATLQWEDMGSSLDCITSGHACCAVRGALVVLGGEIIPHPEADAEDWSDGEDPVTSRVEIFPPGEESESLPSLSCGGIEMAVAIAVEESVSMAGQVLLLGGAGAGDDDTAVHLVDLFSGVCTPQPALLNSRRSFAAARALDGRVVCAGGWRDGLRTAEVFGPPINGASDAVWTWTALSAMSAGRADCRGCVMSDGRFAVLGGCDVDSMDHMVASASCEAVVIGEGEHWTPLPSMHQARAGFACAAVARCIIVADGNDCESGPVNDAGEFITAEVYDEGLNRWLRLPSRLPEDYDSWVTYADGSALI